MNRNALRCLVLAVAAAVPAAADEFVLPILALQWPGKAGNQWNSEIFLTNPGPTTVTVTNGRFLPGTLRYDVQCFPPIAAFHLVAPYSTVLLPPQTLYLDLECPVAALGAMAFDADGPVVISSRVVNTFGLAPSEGVLAGLGQDLPAFATADLAGPGAVYQLPGLIWDPFRCGPPAFEIYLYLANPGGAPVVVTLQQSATAHPASWSSTGTSCRRHTRSRWRPGRSSSSGWSREEHGRPSAVSPSSWTCSSRRPAGSPWSPPTWTGPARTRARCSRSPPPTEPRGSRHRILASARCREPPRGDSHQCPPMRRFGLIPLCRPS